MKSARPAVVALLASALAAATFASVATAHETKFRANNGFGQEMQGWPQDGENAGSDNGRGVPQGGPGAGEAGESSKQDGSDHPR